MSACIPPSGPSSISWKDWFVSIFKFYAVGQLQCWLLQPITSYVQQIKSHSMYLWSETNCEGANSCSSQLLWISFYNWFSINFVSNPQLASSCSIVPPLSSSDHNGIVIQMRWRQPGSHNCPNNSKGRTIWLYNHADWDRAIELIDNCDWNALLGQDVSESLTNWRRKFLSTQKSVLAF